ncbi:MAG: histidine kinase [Acidobacteriota bacterium]|jgi:signal transduction histidine kinase
MDPNPGSPNRRGSPTTGRTLRGRLHTLLVQWLVVFLAVSGLIGVFALRHMREHVEQDRLLLARTVAHYLDSTLLSSLQGAGRLVSELPDPLEEESRVRTELRSFRFQCLFRNAIHLLDEDGEVLVSDPPYAAPPPTPFLEGDSPIQRPRISALVRRERREGSEDRPVLVLSYPFEREGRMYRLVAEMSPRGSTVSVVLQNLAPEPGLHLVVVDVAARVVAAPDHEQLFRVMEPADQIGARIRARRPLVTVASSCTICGDPPRPGDYLTVMIPLRNAPWGIAIQQDESEAFAVLGPSQTGFVATAALLLLMALLLSRGLGRSVIEPIDQLSERAERLRRGDLDSPITVEGDRELQILARSLDEARHQLGSSLAELTSLNEHLEELVADRTRELRSRYEDLQLLYDVAALCAQERRASRFIPPVLRRISQRFSFHAVALVATPPDAPERAYVHPERTSLPWLAAGAHPPAGWQRFELVYHDELKGVLFFRWPESAEQPAVEALQHELALSLHSAYQLRRTLVQDAQRKVLVRRLLAAAEEERRRIARELHDEISQLLTAIQLSLQQAAEKPEERGRLQRAEELLTRTQQEVHRVIHDLRPSLLDDLGLTAAVRWYAERYLEPEGIEVNLEVPEELDRPDLELPGEVEITAFRIYQEIITNILRHARAEHVSIELELRAGDGGNGRDGTAPAGLLVLAVEDDGVGFVQDEHTGGGAGLVGMRERAGLVGGTIEIDSEPGLGTHVRLEIPLD